MQYVKTLNRFIERFLIIIAGMALVLLMVLAAGNVILRIFGIPFQGTYELAGFLGAVVIALALGHTQRRKGHIVVDIVSRKLPEKMRRLINVVNYAVCAVFFGVVTVELFNHGMRLRRFGEVSETLKVVYYPVVLCVCLGFAVLVLALLIDLVTILRPPDEERQR